MWIKVILLCIFTVAQQASTQTPTLYQVYNEGGLVNPTGPALVAEGPEFSLNGKDFHILSGAIHYFRVHPDYWQDRIRKLKAVGANTLETYVPWNLHEELPGQYNFTGRLDIRRFLQIAKQEDLFVILRPGPYICAEWEFGGLPSWLLRNPDIKVRTSDPAYTSPVVAYFQQLIPLITDLQFTNGGSIIAVQVENEYGSFLVDDPDYLELLRTTMQNSGVVELFANSDSCPTDSCRIVGTLPGLLMTTNFQDQPDANLNQLARLQPDRPLMVMEHWTGWFDHWGENHHTVDADTYAGYVNEILARNASLSMYMFHGGTSFGFMNGANTDLFGVTYQRDVTSYDYDAQLSESGDYTLKYNITRQIFTDFSKGRLWDVPLPDLPPETEKEAYGDISIQAYLNFDDILSLVTPQASPDVVPMELLDLYGNSGQNFGFIVYRKTITISDTGSELILSGLVNDYTKIFIDDEIAATVDTSTTNATVSFSPQQAGSHDLKIIYENSGRGNFGFPWELNFDQQAKGLKSPVYLDSVPLTDWNIYSLDFNQAFLDTLTAKAPWRNFTSPSDVTYPGLMTGTLTIAGTPHDTFLSLNSWFKGIVVVNNFVLGRYWDIGPQKALYVPAPLLVQGDNKIYVFELASCSNTVTFQGVSNLG